MSKPHYADTVKAARQAAIFSALTDEAVERVLAESEVVTFRSGGQIFRPHQPADRFFVVLSGQVKIFKLSARGDEQILHLYGPGETFGEAAMWSGGSFPAHAEAISDCRLLSVRRRTLERMLAADAGVAAAMLAGMSAKLHEFARLIEELSLKEVPARLARVLLDEAAASGSNVIRLKQTKRQLASQIGTVAETLSRALAKMKAQGLIEVRGSKITLLDERCLAELVERG